MGEIDELDMMDEFGEERENGCELEVGKDEVVKWEEFMPKMMIRVLLVEADYSTRQILTALLRKCNYKVAAIADGLQAWDILKKRHSCIDLVLTELDLPSISGYALLTLIMEHDGCKNIPVIMTSSQDSISMVLKCILKGAADFLIKPVRKNELKNLWRHVWRRLAVNGVHDPHYVSKVEAAFENNSATNNSADLSTSRRSSKCSGKATDVEDLSWMKCSKGIGLNNKETEHSLKNVTIENDLALLTTVAEGKAVRSESGGQSNNEGDFSVALRDDEEGSSTGLATEDESVGHANYKRKADANVDADDLRPSDPCRGAIDLIGNMKRQKCVVAQASYDGDFSNLNSTPELELSLRRVHDSVSKKLDERRTLNHSNASAFSRYNNNIKSQTAVPLSISEILEVQVAADSSPCPKTFNRRQVDKPIADLQSDLVSQPGTVSNGGVWAVYHPINQPMSSSFAGPCPDVSAKNLKSGFHRDESPFLTSPSLHSDPETLNSTVDNSSGKEEQEVGKEEQEVRNSSSQIVGPSCSSTLCNDVADQKKISACGNASELTDHNVNSPGMAGISAIVKEVKKDNDRITFEVDQFRHRKNHHSAEREAALAKFRLKRKGRCYEKKVRYHSRKTLAEQRLRVKGQFVRQVPADKMLAHDGKT